MKEGPQRIEIQAGTRDTVCTVMLILPTAYTHTNTLSFHLRKNTPRDRKVLFCADLCAVEEAVNNSC